MAIIQNLEAFVQSYPAGLDSVTDLQLSQNENGRQIRFTIGGVTIPAGSVATISGTKPDGVVYSNTGTIEGSDTVIFDEDVQMTAVFGTWYAKIRITNAGNTIASARVRFIIDKDPVDAGAIPSESQLNGLVAEAEEYAGAAEDAAERAAITYGSPLTAATASAMTDINRVYVYTGSESGYTYGNWYYYNGSAWVSGGVYNSAAVETDTTLTESGVPADAKATGDKIAELKDDLGEILGSETEVLTPLAYTQTGYYIILDGTTADLDNPNPSVFGHAYIVALCSAGDEFLVNAKGGGRPRAWGFINAQNEIISVADANVTVTNLRLTAPSGATRLIINDNSSPNLTSYRITTSHTGGVVVRYDIEQNNTQTERERARRNLGINAISGLSDDAKEALLACFQHTAWIDEHGQSYYDALYDALYADTPTPAFDYGVYDPETIVDGKYIDENGDIQTASGTFYIGDYIPVVRSNYWIGMNPSSLRVPAPGTAPTNESNWRISEYDESKNFIKQTHFEDTNDLCSSILYDFDSNTKYIRLGWSDSNSSTNSKEFDIENPARITVCPVEVGNIDASTGANSDSTTRVRTVGYIPASNTISITGCPFYDSWSDWTSLWITAGYSNQSFFYVVRCYDSNKEFLSTLTYNGSGTINQDISNVALPEGTAYIRMLFQTENHAELSISCVNHLTTINGTRYYMQKEKKYFTKWSTSPQDSTWGQIVISKNINIADAYISGFTYRPPGAANDSTRAAIYTNYNYGSYRIMHPTNSQSTFPSTPLYGIELPPRTTGFNATFGNSSGTCLYVFVFDETVNDYKIVEEYVQWYVSSENITGLDPTKRYLICGGSKYNNLQSISITTTQAS